MIYNFIDRDQQSYIIINEHVFNVFLITEHISESLKITFLRICIISVTLSEIDLISHENISVIAPYNNSSGRNILTN